MGQTVEGHVVGGGPPQPGWAVGALVTSNKMPRATMLSIVRFIFLSSLVDEWIDGFFVALQQSRDPQQSSQLLNCTGTF